MATGTLPSPLNAILAKINLASAPTVGSGSIDDLMGGVYYCRNNAVSGLPEGTNGWVIAFNNSEPAWYKQIFIRQGTPGSNDGNVYIRAKNSSNSSWGSWWKFTGTKVT